MRGEPFLYPGAVTAPIRDFLARDDSDGELEPLTLGKLGIRDRVELTRYAIRRGLIEP
jgi:hypothetical protein